MAERSNSLIDSKETKAPQSPADSLSSEVDEEHSPPEKIEPLTTIDSVSSPIEGPQSFWKKKELAWTPSLFRIRPAIGLGAIGIAILCLFTSLGVLLGSNGTPIDGWAFQPTVYLAIATALSNTALHCALAQAAPISWW